MSLCLNCHTSVAFLSLFNSTLRLWLSLSLGSSPEGNSLTSKGRRKVVGLAASLATKST